MKTSLSCLLVRKPLGWTSAMILGLSVFNASALDVVAPLGSPAAEAARGQPAFSPGVNEVIKMLDAKVDPAVVKAYIATSPVAYNPSADEIVAMKNKGVPDDVITAMLQRGAEVRKQGPMSMTAPQVPPSNYAPGAPYAYPAYPDYNYDAGMPSSYADFSFGWPYEYPYGYNWWWYYGYPFAYYSPFYTSWYWHYPYYHHYGHFGGPWRYHNYWGSHSGWSAWGNHGSWNGSHGTWNGNHGTWTGTGNHGSTWAAQNQRQSQAWRPYGSTSGRINGSAWAPYSGSYRYGTYAARPSMGSTFGTHGGAGAFHGSFSGGAAHGGSSGSAHFGGGGGGFHGGGGGGFHGGGGGHH